MSMVGIEVRAKPWDRLLWGVVFVAPPYGVALVDDTWDHNNVVKQHRAGEPSRALLFCSREQARRWCRKQNKPRSRNRFRAVPVRERVEVVKAHAEAPDQTEEEEEKS